jgi:hypothetical protein
VFALADGALLAWPIILGETALGLALVLTRRARSAWWLACASMSAALTAVVFVAFVDAGVECGCMGAFASRATDGRRMLIAGSLMLLSVVALKDLQDEMAGSGDDCAPDVIGSESRR